MKQYEFTEDFEKHKKGDTMIYDGKIYHAFIHPLLMKGVLMVIEKDKKIREKVKEEMSLNHKDSKLTVLKDENIEEKKEDSIVPNEFESQRFKAHNQLMEFKMGKLRDFGKKYGAFDTKKSELVEEIIEKAPNNDIIKFIEGDK